MKKLILLIFFLGIIQTKAQINFLPYDVPSKGFATSIVKSNDGSLVVTSNGIFYSSDNGSTWKEGETPYDFAEDYTDYRYLGVQTRRS
jgi:hypothetical protein